MNKIKFENEFKGFLKRKFKVTTALILTFLILGLLAMPQTTEQQLQELEKKVKTLEAKVLGSNIIFGDKAKDEYANGKKT